MKPANCFLWCLIAMCGLVFAGPGTERGRGGGEPGRLGVPLGKIVEVQATVRAGEGEAYLLELTSIDGIALPSLGRMQFRVEPIASGHGLVADRATLAKVWPGRKVEEAEKNYVGKKFRMLVEESKGFTSAMKGFGEELAKRSVGTTGLVVWQVLATNAEPEPSDRDPDQIRWAAGLSKEQFRDREVLRLVGSWFNRSPKAVSEKLKGLAPGPTRDAGLAVFCRSIGAADPEAARRWAGEISDLGLRESVLKELERSD